MQRMLQAQSGLALLRRFLLAALALVAGGVGHGVGLVEDDDAVETCPGPTGCPARSGRPSQSMICCTRLAFSPRAWVRRVA